MLFESETAKSIAFFGELFTCDSLSKIYLFVKLFVKRKFITLMLSIKKALKISAFF